MLVVPLSGSLRSSSLKSTGLPLASSFSARVFAFLKSAALDDGIPHRTITSSRSPPMFRTIGASLSGKMPGIGGRFPVMSRSTLNRLRIAAWFFVIE
jgi:hypothetical protein